MNELDEIKIRKEIEKLDAEIKQASLKWWKKPSYIGLLLTFTSIIVGILTGFIDLKKLEIGYENQIKEIKGDHSNELDSLNQIFKNQSDSLNEGIERLNLENNRLVVFNDSIRGKNKTLKISNLKLINKTRRTKQERDSYLNQVNQKKEELKKIAIAINDISDKRIKLNSQILVTCDYAYTSMRNPAVNDEYRFGTYDTYIESFYKNVKEYVDSTSTLYIKYEEVFSQMKKDFKEWEKNDGHNDFGVDLYKSESDDNRRVLMYFTDKYFDEQIKILLDETKTMIK